MTMIPIPSRALRRALRLGAVGALTGCLALSGTAWADFTAADTSEASVAAGSVDLDWAATDAAPLSLEIGPLRPGETTRQLVDLENRGTVAVSRMQLAYSGGTSPATDLSDGIQMTVEECTVPWTGTAESTSCSGTTTRLAEDRPVTGRTDLTGTTASATGATSHLRFTFRLPDSSPDTAQDTATTVDFAVLGNQRPGEHR